MNSIESLTPEMCIKQLNVAKQLLSTNFIKTKIPVINNWKDLSRLKNTQLVRFRGLVQNMFDPEIYLETYEVKITNEATEMRSAKFCDTIELEVTFL